MSPVQSKLLFIIFLLFQQTLFAQKKDSLPQYYQAYEFQKVVNTLQLETDISAPDYFILAKSYNKLGQSKKALTAINKAIEQEKSNISYLNFLGEQQLKQDKKIAAYGTYLKLCKLQPSNAYYYKRIGQALNNSSFHQAKEQQILFANGDSLPKTEEGVKVAQEKFRALNLPSHVWDAYQKAIELNPNDIESKLILVELYLKMNNLGGADPLVRKCLELHPEEEKFVSQAINIAYRLRDYQDVVEKCKLYYSIADSSLTVQKMEGIASFQLNEFQKTIDLLSAVIEVDQDSEVLHYFLGLANQELGNMEEAALYLQKAIELGITENIGKYYTRLAIVQEELGNLKKSIQLYKAAYQETNDKILLYHLARNYDTFYKDKTTAIKYYKLYLEELDSSNIEYLEYAKSRIHELKVEKHFDLDTL